MYYLELYSVQGEPLELQKNRNYFSAMFILYKAIQWTGLDAFGRPVLVHWPYVWHPCFRLAGKVEARQSRQRPIPCVCSLEHMDVYISELTWMWMRDFLCLQLRVAAQ